MPQAYVAKASAADPSVPGDPNFPYYPPPPGWDIDWPFPGVSPPGFELPSSRCFYYQLVMTAETYPTPAAPYYAYTHYGTIYAHPVSGLFDTPWAYTTMITNQRYYAQTWTNTGGAWTLSDFGIYLPEDKSYVWQLGLSDSSDAIKISAVEALRLNEEETYVMSYRGVVDLPEDHSVGFVTYDFSLHVFVDGKFDSTTTKQVVLNDGEDTGGVVEWLRVNGSTGEVTVTNP